MSVPVGLIDARYVGVAGVILLLLAVGFYRRRMWPHAAAAGLAAVACLAGSAIAEGTPGLAVIVLGLVIGQRGLTLDERGNRGAGLAVLAVGVVMLSGGFMLLDPVA
jgi:hypothetical protein